MTRAIAATTRTHQGGHPHGNEDTGWVGADAWAVADGMGGHAAGEIASAVAVEAVAHVLEEAVEVPSVARARALVAEAVAQAGAALRARADGDEQVRAMGTTLVLAVLCDDDGAASLVVGNVGDSRAYLLAAQGLVRLTRDDNVAEDMLARGLLDPEQAATHPGQYQLTKALTAYDAQSPEPTITQVRAAGRLLLCSDGLCGELSDATIAELLGRGDVAAAAAALVDTAVRAPARDNVTVVVADLPG